MHFAGAAGKIPVFGLLKRGGHVYTAMLADTRAATLSPIIRSKVAADSIDYTDGYAAYEAWDVFEFCHERNPYPWHWKLLEPGQATLTPLQRHCASTLSLVPERVRMALQWWLAQQPFAHTQTMGQAPLTGKSI